MFNRGIFPHCKCTHKYLDKKCVCLVYAWTREKESTCFYCWWKKSGIFVYKKDCISFNYECLFSFLEFVEFKVHASFTWLLFIDYRGRYASIFSSQSFASMPQLVPLSETHLSCIPFIYSSYYHKFYYFQTLHCKVFTPWVPYVSCALKPF